MQNALKIASVLLIIAGLFLNEWVLAALLSSDGNLEPLDCFRIRMFDGFLILTGIGGLLISRAVQRSGGIVAFLRSYPKLFGLGISCCTLALALAALELGARVLVPKSASPQGEFEAKSTLTPGKKVPSLTLLDEQFGFRPRPDTSVHFRQHLNGKTLYEVDYLFDQFSRRITGEEQSDEKEESALFFGCSFTLGEGVQGHETLPAVFERKTEKYRSYNFGFRGYGPQQMLEHIKTLKSNVGINEPAGIALYAAIDDHLPRLVGSYRITKGVRGRFPYYQLDDGELVRRGSFRSSRLLRQFSYELLGESVFLAQFEVDWPLTYGPDSKELYCSLLEACVKGLRDKYPNVQFHMILFPGNSLIEASWFADLEKRGVLTVHDLSDLYGKDDEANWIPIDGHPSPTGYEIVAKELVQRLSQ